MLLFAVVIIIKVGKLTIDGNNRLRAHLVYMNRTPISFAELGNQVVRLNEMTSHLDSYSISEIKNAMHTSAILAEIARSEFESQYNSWLYVQGKIGNDTDSLLKLREQLNLLQNLNDKEITRLKKVIDDTNRPSIFESSFNLLLSFVLGVLSSILASHIYTKYQRRTSTASDDPTCDS